MPQKNLLLAALPPDVQARVVPYLELTHLALGEVLYESGGSIRNVYFPTNAIVSLLYVMERQRGLDRGLGLHGRGEHAEPGGRTERG